jgi:hypothetical protein
MKKLRPKEVKNLPKITQQEEALGLAVYNLVLKLRL